MPTASTGVREWAFIQLENLGRVPLNVGGPQSKDPRLSRGGGLT